MANLWVDVSEAATLTSDQRELLEASSLLQRAGPRGGGGGLDRTAPGVTLGRNGEVFNTFMDH